jgi:hypothetical protein
MHDPFGVGGARASAISIASAFTSADVVTVFEVPLDLDGKPGLAKA